MALVLAACGGETPAGKPAEQAATTSGQAPTTSATLSRQADGGVQPVAAEKLDTAAWLMQPPFYAAGEEPNWRIDIEDGWFSFKRSGLPGIDAPLVQPVRENGADVFDTPPLKVSIKKTTCQTESAGQAEYTVDVVLDGVSYEGCAFAGHSNGGSPEAASVVENLAPIDACLKQLQKPALITAAFTRESERTGVGLRGKDGILYDCAVEKDGTVAYLDPIEPSQAGPWMTKMRFLRAGVADDAKCDGADEVRSGDTLIGRLLTPKCRF
ncbi:MAG TPA: hypothetical protein VGO52_02705 [Hyphomonadaceae bacterium]|jgi:uncharacterized membrane protein|nr:hypothetical protein [Hyphomonadaceae bacterium]